MSINKFGSEGCSYLGCLLVASAATLIVGMSSCKRISCPLGRAERGGECVLALIDLELRTQAGDAINFIPAQYDYNVTLPWLLHEAELVADTGLEGMRVELAVDQGEPSLFTSTTSLPLQIEAGAPAR